MMRRRFLRYGVSLVLSCTSCSSYAFFEGSISTKRWEKSEYRWRYNPASAPSWLTDQEAREIVFAASLSWSACGVKIILDGETDQVPGRMDGVNVFGWSSDHSFRQRGMTIGRSKGALIYEKDVVISSSRQEFARFQILLKKVIMHEFGHALGLSHSKHCSDVMAFGADCPNISPADLPTNPSARDIAECQRLYLN
jgi:hypothetical protein